MRIGPIDLVDDVMPPNGVTAIKNCPDGQSQWPAVDIVSPDALARVRFGLRSAHDSRNPNTVRVIDHLLKVDLPQGPVWRRYNEDGYGEHEDGRPLDGTGIGRAWPLLTGERDTMRLPPAGMMKRSDCCAPSRLAPVPSV